MKWAKRGLVWAPDGSQAWARTHAMCPTPIILQDDVIRVYLTTFDGSGRGHATYVDVSAFDPTRVINASRNEVLGPGCAGAFDDNGIMPISVIKVGSLHYMYYAGFELCSKIRYRIFTGLAVSEDNGETFGRYSSAPILDRTDGEVFFRGGPFSICDAGIFRLWYVGGSSWITIDGKDMPVYDLRYAQSDDGKAWPDEGLVCLAITNEDEHGFGRPWVIKRGEQDYQMFYSIRRRSLKAYRLGYAESQDGINWIRKDDEMGLDVTPGSFDSHAIMYSAVVSSHGKTYCFYNGNDFGKDGFAVAELVE